MPKDQSSLTTPRKRDTGHLHHFSIPVRNMLMAFKRLIRGGFTPDSRFRDRQLTLEVRRMPDGRVETKLDGIPFIVYDLRHELAMLRAINEGQDETAISTPDLVR